MSSLSFRMTIAGIRHGYYRAGGDLLLAEAGGHSYRDAQPMSVVMISTGGTRRILIAIDRSNVWISGIEWVMLFRKSALIAVGWI